MTLQQLIYLTTVGQGDCGRGLEGCHLITISSNHTEVKRFCFSDRAVFLLDVQIDHSFRF